jgi:branched-chain amino acid transport system substrate-binding protein
MKRWFSLVAVVVLCLSLVIGVACGGDDDEGEAEIKIGVIGPMAYVQGEHHWYGAQLAAEEINAEGGVLVGGESYQIKLVQVDSNEILSVTDAASAMEKAITRDNADFLVGGFRTEAVFAMQDVAMDYEKIFLGCGASADELCTRVADDYDRYKYWFRVTPINSTNLGRVDFALIAMVAEKIKAELGIEVPKVAILAEKAVWADPIVEKSYMYITAMGMEIIGEWRPSATASEVTAELSAIENAGAHIIFTSISGPVGIPYATQWGELEITAASVGINVEAQKEGFWDATGGKGNYEMTMNTYARVNITEETIPFVDRFVERVGELPTYSADTYSAISLLSAAIERAGTLDSDAVVAELEKTDTIGTAGRLVFTEDHDVTWGPGYVTGLGVQWQDGEMKCVWPPAGGAWEGVDYGGTVDYILPPWVVEEWGP